MPPEPGTLPAVRRSPGSAAESPECLARLQPFLTANGDTAAYAEAGRDLGMSEGAVKVAVCRLRERFREILREEVAQTLAEDEPTLVDVEIRHLMAALQGGP